MNDSSVKPAQSVLISLILCLPCEIWLVVGICKVNAMFSNCNCNITIQNKIVTKYFILEI